MTFVIQKQWSRSCAVLAGIALLGCAGCGGSPGPKTFAVTGQVQLADAGSEVLAGHFVEAALESDPSVRAYGEIGEDGKFALESLHSGSLRPGAVEGRYRVRVALADDDVEARKQAAQALHPRYLDFEKSGLSIQVPGDDPVSLPLSRQ
jgi:hypothetical protein